MIRTSVAAPARPAGLRRQEPHLIPTTLPSLRHVTVAWQRQEPAPFGGAPGRL
jgi:hypothetical protein